MENNQAVIEALEGGILILMRKYSDDISPEDLTAKIMSHITDVLHRSALQSPISKEAEYKEIIKDFTFKLAEAYQQLSELKAIQSPVSKEGETERKYTREDMIAFAEDCEDGYFKDHSKDNKFWYPVCDLLLEAPHTTTQLFTEWLKTQSKS
jgi:hypothetical protein